MHTVIFRTERCRHGILAAKAVTSECIAIILLQKVTISQYIFFTSSRQCPVTPDWLVCGVCPPLQLFATISHSAISEGERGLVQLIRRHGPHLSWAQATDTEVIRSILFSNDQKLGESSKKLGWHVVWNKLMPVGTFSCNNVCTVECKRRVLCVSLLWALASYSGQAIDISLIPFVVWWGTEIVCSRMHNSSLVSDHFNNTSSFICYNTPHPQTCHHHDCWGSVWSVGRLWVCVRGVLQGGGRKVMDSCNCEADLYILMLDVTQSVYLVW